MRRTLLGILICLMSVTLWINQSYAVPAKPGLLQYVQPNGTTITIMLKGDEMVKWALSEDGYTLMRNTQGIFEYAIQDSNGDLIPSGVEANNLNKRTQAELSLLSTTAKGIFYSKEQVSMMKSIWDIKTKEGQKVFPTTGSRKLICILMGFKDKAFTKTQTDFNNLFNQVGYSTGGATGSVKDYYMENSWGQFNLSVDVFGPYTASQNMSYYGGNDASGNDLNPRALVTEAVNAADATANFANYDNDGDGTVDGVYVIYAGYGEEAGASADCIWAHAWSITTVYKDGVSISKYSCSAELSGSTGTTITAIGVICHEFGHVLGAPDYYDTNYSTGGSFLGTGNWDIMASGSWNNSGITPAHHNAYTKSKVYNWASATVLSSAAGVEVTDIINNKSIYQINSTTANEYWLMENRQQMGFDSKIPGHGLIIYHISKDIATYSTSNTINASYPQRMYPVCASATTNPGTTSTTYGSINSTGCPFPGTANKTSFTDATTPNMKSWAGANTSKPMTNIAENTTTKVITFDFMGGATTGTAPATPAGLSATAITTTGATLNWTADANATSYTVKVGTSTYTTSTNTYALSGLTPNTAYSWSVMATNSYGSSSYSATSTFTTSALPTGASLPFSEVFSSSSIPTGWTTQNSSTSITQRWSASKTNKAGGVAYELKCSYQNITGTTKIITPAINTTGVNAATLTFRHFLDADKAGPVLKVRTSTDLATWTDSEWSVTATTSNINATAVTVNLTNNLNSPTTYVAFELSGNLYYIDYWYIDNVAIAATVAPTVTTPTVTTATISAITTTTATAGGNVTADGNATVTERGVCYSTAQNPTTANSKVVAGSGTGTFTASLTGLTASTTYYVRAYATNSAGTAYGTQVSFTTSATTPPPANGLPFSETFSSSTMPTGWTTQNSSTSITQRWSISNTNKAGGAAYELKCTYQNITGTTKIITPAINTTGTTAATLTFRHFLDAYKAGPILKVQTSNDLTTWTDSDWSVTTSTSNINATTVTVNLTKNLNSTTTYVAFVVTGNLYYIDYWYIDNVSIVAGAKAPSTNPTPNEAINNIYSIYPNPATSTLNIAFEDLSAATPVSIYDLQGRLMKRIVVSNTTTSIDIDDLNRGVYIISVENGKEAIVKRFVKQ